MFTEVSVPGLDRDLDTSRQMPKIQFKEETLNGRAHIIAYADREYLTLRVHRGDKKYTNISLGTTDLKVAHDKALDVYAATINTPPASLSKRTLFETVCEDFLAWKKEQSEIGEIKESTVTTYSQRILRVIPFAKKVGVHIGASRKIVLRVQPFIERLRLRESGQLLLTDFLYLRSTLMLPLLMN